METKGRHNEMLLLLLLSPLFIAERGRLKDWLYASGEPVLVRLIKLATSKAIDRPPRPIKGT